MNLLEWKNKEGSSLIRIAIKRYFMRTSGDKKENSASKMMIGRREDYPPAGG
jgi:hypothetical protein